jgi:hypothetical protein
MIDLGAEAPAGLADAADAQRAAHRQHERIGHHRRQTAVRQRRLGDVAPQRAGRRVERVVGCAAGAIAPDPVRG